MDLAAIIKTVNDPDAFARPMPMWFWNGKLDQELFVAQMEDMAEKGVRAFFIHPMPSEFRPKDFVAGLEAEYLGEAYFEAVRFVVEAAAGRGMKVWLYDEGGWPSGSNLGRVTEERPDLCGKVAHYNEQGQVEILERGYPVDLLDAETTKTFIKQVHERYKAFVGNHFGSTIPGFFTDEPRYGGRVGGAEIPWTPTLPEVFKGKKGYDITLGLSILFGLKSSRSLPADKRAQVLCDFYHVVTQLWRDNYFRVLQEWCRENDLLLVGHISAEDSLSGHVTNGGDFFKAMECLDWPGIDAIARQVFPGTENEYPKFASSAAHLREKNRVLSESFAVYGWDLTFQQMKWVTDFQYVRGVNALAPMAFYSDATGPRKIATMSDQFLTNPLFAHYRQYAEYVGRLGALLSLGKPVVEVAVYYPIKSLWVSDVGELGGSVETVLASLSTGLLERQIDFDYVDDDAICRATIEKDGALAVGDCRYRAILFPMVSIVPIETLRQLREFAEAGGSVIFLYGEPHLTCRAASQSELPEILKAMATFTVSDGSDVDVVLGTLPWTVKLGISNHEIRVLRRTTGDVELFFITNQSMTREQALRVRLPVEGAVHTLDPETGEVRKAVVAGGAVRFTLPPSGSSVLLVTKESLDVPAELPAAPPDQTKKIDGPWTLSVVEKRVCRDGEIIRLRAVDDDEAGDIADALSMWEDEPKSDGAEDDERLGSPIRLEELADWDTVFHPAFCGTVEYLVACEIEGRPARVVLDLGTVGVVAEVFVDNQSAGKRIWPPYRFDITDSVVPGLNTVRIIVTSTLHRLMSDEIVVADLKQRGWYNVYARQVEKFAGDPAPAGLIGPVKLEMWS